MYVVESGGLLKIGTSTDVERRLRSLQSGSAAVLTVIGVMDGGRLEEQALHTEFAGSRLHGEWFRLSEEEEGRLRLRLRPHAPRPPGRAGRPRGVPTKVVRLYEADVDALRLEASRRGMSMRELVARLVERAGLEGVRRVR